MVKSIKKSLSFILASMLMFTVFAYPVSAAVGDPEIVASGTCGEKVTWTLDSEGTLIISGEGDTGIYSYYSDSISPLFDYKASIKNVIIESGVEKINANLFYLCNNIETFKISDTVSFLDNTVIALYFTEICVDDNNPYFCNDAMGILYNKDKTVLLRYPERRRNTSLTIPDGVIKIGPYAFDHVSFLNIIFPASTKVIGDHAFSYGGSSTNIYMNDGLETIEKYAFYNSYITNITIPDTVSEIGNGAFAHCGSLQQITLPKNLTKLSTYLFNYCTSLRKITLPDSITTIEDSAFDYCYNLMSVNIPKALEYLGSVAFGNCKALKCDIVLPDTLKTIGSSPFSYSGVEKITINKYLSGIDKIFEQMFSLCEIKVDDQNPYYSSDGVCLYNKDKTRLIKVPAKINLSTFTVPDFVSVIGEKAFYCSSLEEIIIPDNVTSIENSAFSSCYQLEKINIPTSITTLNAYLFMYCKALKSINIPNSITTIGNSAFKGCESLEAITIPISVSLIDQNAFSGCTSLKTLTLYEHTFSIYGNAFTDCPIEKIYFIGTNAGWERLKNLVPQNTSLEVFLTAEAIVIRGTCGDNLNANFNDSTGTLFINGSGDMQSFADPQSVLWYDLKDSIKEVIFTGEITSIGSYAFSGLTALKSITIPDSVTRIETKAFADNTFIEQIILPKEISQIEKDTFSGCSSLTDITIPDSVTAIGEKAFEGCAALPSINIPDGIDEIKDRTFAGCTSLKEITLPESVTSIGDEAFFGCTALDKITVGNSITHIGKKAFDNTGYSENPSSYFGRNRVLYIGENRQYLVAYADAALEQSFNGKTLSSTVLIADEVFKNADCESVILNDGLKLIGKDAFAGSALREIVFPDSVEACDRTAFSGCSDVTVRYGGTIAQWSMLRLPVNGDIYYTLKNADSSVIVTYCDADLSSEAGDVNVSDKLPNLEVDPINFSEASKNLRDKTFTSDNGADFNPMNICLRNCEGVLQPNLNHSVTLKLKVDDNIRKFICDTLGYDVTEFDQLCIKGGELYINGSKVENQNLSRVKQRVVVWHNYNDGMYENKRYVTYIFCGANTDPRYMELENGYLVMNVRHFSEFSTVVNSIKLESDSYSLLKGESLTPDLRNVAEIGVSFKSHDPNVVKVDANGNLTAVGKGVTTVDVLVGEDPVDTCTVSVTDPTCSINDYKTSITINYKSSVSFSYTADNIPAGASVHWYINNTDRGTDPTYTASNVKDAFTVKLVMVAKDGSVLAESEEEIVNVEKTWWQWLIWIFLFGFLWY